MADTTNSTIAFSKSDLPRDRITLFDMRFATPDGRLSPYTTLIRYALKVKSLPFNVQFVDMQDIRAASEYMGCKPVFMFPDGTPLYTLPAIWDPLGNAINIEGNSDITGGEGNGKGVAIADSLPICQYLDKQYPDAPNLISTADTSINGHTAAQCTSFLQAYRPVDLAILPFITPQMLIHVPPQSVSYFRKTREGWWGKTMEEMRPVGEEAAQQWAKVKEGFENLALDRVIGGDETRYRLEKRLKGLRDGSVTPGYVDTFLAGRLYWIRKTFGEPSEEWRDVKTWSGGMWGELLELFEERYN
ncbi:hypothetical protein BJ165DRAFT_1399951 [Panaeolus papilionaceus]|nr:hypothetical protein BJ165DRAFT_1399951 [Panaeolus papilionaceus]